MTDSEPEDQSSAVEQASTPLQIFLYEERQRVLATVLDVPLDIGRQREGEPPPATRLDHALGARVIVAPIQDVEVSRSHVAIDRAAGGKVRVANTSRSLPIKLSPNQALGPGESSLHDPPVLVQFGKYAVRVDPAEDEDELELEALPEPAVPPGKQSDPDALSRLSGGATFDEVSLLRWVETLLTVFQSAASSHDFPEQAAFAVVKIVGLDGAAMLRCHDEGRWQVEALHSTLGDDEASWAPSQTLLARVRREKRTFRHVPAVGADTPRSLRDVSALVAAPILDGNGEVIGALYGDRRTNARAGFAPAISAFEAKLVELLASGIAAGIARLQEEQAALSARVQFQQFFTAQLANQLERDPKLLDGRDADVTLLFADIRGFSRISEQLGPARTMAWIQDVMGELSECVLANDGVLVDYIGDELMAMWGAPAPQANHAHLACAAARQMLAALPSVNERWESELGAPVRLGIGVNSGIARVGNTGSRQKFQYGPLGDVVNVASRVQGATKYLGADCLITGDTLAALPSGIAARRLARARAVNIEQPIDLYEIVAQPPPDWDQRCAQYNEALEALEKDDVDRAAAVAQRLTVQYGDDTAIIALSSRVREAKSESRVGDTSIWRLPGK